MQRNPGDADISSLPSLLFLSTVLTYNGPLQDTEEKTHTAVSIINPSLPLRPYHLAAFMLIVTPVVLQDILFPMLDLSSQRNFSLTSVGSQILFKDKVSANQLMLLMATYEIKNEINDKLKNSMLVNKIYYELSPDGKQVIFNTNNQGTEVENPIIKLAYAILKDDSELMMKKGQVTTPSECTFKNCSTLEYICRSGNFVMLELISQLIPGGAEKVAAAKAALKIEESSYDVVLMPVLAAGKKIASLKYNRMILLPAEEKIPFSIPQDAILVQMKDNQLTTYRMADEKTKTLEKIKPDKSVNLNTAIKPVQTQPIQNQSNAGSLDPSESIPQVHENYQGALVSKVISIFSKLEKKQEITSDRDPHLFETIRLLCGYPPPLQNKSILIKQINEQGDINKIIQWDNMNGLYQERELIWFDDIDLIPNQMEGGAFHPEKHKLYVQFEENGLRCMVFGMNEPLLIEKKDLNNQNISSLKNIELLKDDILKIISTRKHHILDYTLLTDAEKTSFMQLTFPNSSSNQLSTLKSSDIAPNIYSALNKGHPIVYDLGQYTRGVLAFYTKHPDGAGQIDECHEDANKMIRKPQFFMPAWVGQIWVSRTPFNPLPNFYNTILQTNQPSLKLSDGKNFFDKVFKEGEIIYKERYLFAGNAQAWLAGRANDDCTAMITLYPIITEKFQESKELRQTPMSGL